MQERIKSMNKLSGAWIGLLTALPAINIEVYGIKAVRILLIFIGLVLAGQIGKRLINGLMRPDRIPGAWDERRIKTMRGLIKSLLRYALYFVGAIMILPELNVDTTLDTGGGRDRRPGRRHRGPEPGAGRGHRVLHPV